MSIRTDIRGKERDRPGNDAGRGSGRKKDGTSAGFLRYSAADLRRNAMFLLENLSTLLREVVFLSVNRQELPISEPFIRINSAFPGRNGIGRPGGVGLQGRKSANEGINLTIIRRDEPP